LNCAGKFDATMATVRSILMRTSISIHRMRRFRKMRSSFPTRICFSTPTSSGPANLNGGTSLGNGTWTVQTSDLSSLTITPAANFAGAVQLGVTESSTLADGSISSFSFSDNLEAYAAGSPIFALSGDDHLSGAGASDLFVFSQPIGNDIIYNFNAASDTIDLIGFNNFGSFSDIQANLTDDTNGNALITFGISETITLQGFMPHR
jgi:large repetitive protein